MLFDSMKCIWASGRNSGCMEIYNGISYSCYATSMTCEYYRMGISSIAKSCCISPKICWYDPVSYGVFGVSGSCAKSPPKVFALRGETQYSEFEPDVAENGVDCERSTHWPFLRSEASNARRKRIRTSWFRLNHPR